MVGRRAELHRPQPSVRRATAHARQGPLALRYHPRRGKDRRLFGSEDLVDLGQEGALRDAEDGLALRNTKHHLSRIC